VDFAQFQLLVTGPGSSGEFEWSSLGTLPGSFVEAIHYFDSGSDSAIYAGGNFVHSAGTVVDFIKSWDGTSWSSLGMGTSSQVQALQVFDEGLGPNLFVGGVFSQWNFLVAGGFEYLGIGQCHEDIR
jgi:hypothetical protein